MKTETTHLLLDYLLKFFLQKNKLQPFMVIFEICAECLEYLFIVNAPEQIFSVFAFTQTAAISIIIALVTLITIRISSGISFVKLFYPLTFFILISTLSKQTIFIACLIAMLLLLLIAADILSNTKLDFSPLSINA